MRRAHLQRTALVVAAFFALPACRKDEPKAPPPVAAVPAAPVAPIEPAPAPPVPEPAPAHVPPSARPADLLPRKPVGEAAPVEPPPHVAPPVNLTARGASHAVELRWEPAPGPTRPRAYEVVRGDAVVAKVSGNGAKEAGLDNGREYCFAVRSVDAAGQRSEPTPPACAHAFEQDRPPAPTELRATAVSPTEIAVEWKGLPAGIPVRGYEVRGGNAPVVTRETRLRVTGLLPSRHYCFTAFSQNPEGGRGFPSEAACADTPPDVTPPSAPGGVSAVALPGKVQLKWTAAQDDVGVTRYEIVERGAVAGAVVEAFALVSDVAPGEHCYTVLAVDGAGNRSATSAQACARSADFTPPTRPTSVVATAPTETEAVIRWNPSTDEVGVASYEVLRDGKVAATSTLPEARESGLRGTTRYCFTVVAIDAAGNRSAASDAACVFTPDRTPPSRPAQLVATADGDRVEVRWGASTDEVGVTAYEVLRGTERVARVGPGVLSWVDAGPKPASETCYAVRAFDGAGNGSATSAQACVKTPDRSPPSAPEGVTAAPTSASQISLSWNPSTDNAGVAGYEVLRDVRVVAQPMGTSATVGGLSEREQYCFTVRAFDVAGNRSAASTPACAGTAGAEDVPSPANLEATRAGADEVRLRWDPVSGADVTYLVHWDATRTQSGSGAKARSLGSTMLTSFKIFGPPAREKRCFRVVARVGSRESAQTLAACVDAAPK